MDETTQPTEAASYETREGLASLGLHLKNQFEVFKKDRRAAETQWIKNLNQFLGKYDAALAAKMDSDRSRAYPKLTRVKCVSMKARLMSLLFPAGEKNWSLSASPVPNLPSETLLREYDEWRKANPDKVATQADLDQLATKAATKIAERMETVITDQLQDVDPYRACDYETLVGKVVASAVLYGPGIVKGPMTVAEKTSRFVIDATGMPQLVEQDTYRPYLEFVSCWDYFPDMSAATFDQMEGEYQRHVYSHHQLSRLAEREDFYGDVIRNFMASHPDGNYEKSSYETELESIGGQTASQAVGKKYQLLEFWGSCPGRKLKRAGLDVPDGDLDRDVRYTAWLLEGQIVKLAANPFREGTKVYHQFIFEEDEVNLLGSGLPPIMRDSQLAVSSFARMLIDNASLVCGPQLEINVDMLAPNQADYSIKPLKTWLVENTANNGQRAINPVALDSRIPELMSGIELFQRFADGETFVSPLTGGDIDGVPGEAMRTTGGASMVYGNAALPFRDIVRNFDQFTVSVIDALAQWNTIFNVERDKLAGDIRPIPRGATSLMAKEIRAFALDQLAATLTPEERLYINEEALLKQRLAVRDLPLSELMAPEDEVQRRKDAQAQQAQQAQQQAAAMFQAELENIRSDTMKQLTQGQKNLDNAEVAVFRAMVEALTKGATTDELAAIARRTAEGRSGAAGQPGSPRLAAVPQPPAGN